MQILLDGVPYQDVPIDLTQEASPSPARTLSEVEEQWLQTHTIPL